MQIWLTSCHLCVLLSVTVGLRRVWEPPRGSRRELLASSRTKMLQSKVVKRCWGSFIPHFDFIICCCCSSENRDFFPDEDADASVWTEEEPVICMQRRSQLTQRPLLEAQQHCAPMSSADELSGLSDLQRSDVWRDRICVFVGFFSSLCVFERVWVCRICCC